LENSELGNLMSLLWAGITAFVVSLMVTPLVINIAKKFGFVDDPNRYHPAIIHKVITPRAGGVPILIALLTVIFFLPIDRHITAILIGSILTVVLGTLDDKYDLSPILRLIVMFIIATVTVVIGGIGLTFVTNPFGGVIRFDQIIWTISFFGEHNIVVLADILSILWIVWVMNAISWSSGVDGQLSGIAAIAAGVLALVALKYLSIDPEQMPVATVAFMTAGAYFGFLPYSAYPQKIMPGFGGATLAGYLLAVLAMLAGGRLATAVLVLAVPLLDAAWAVYRRIRRGQLPFFGDREHLHHKMIDLGMSRRQIAIVYWLVAAVLGLLALSLDSRGKLFAGVLIIVVVLAMFLSIDARLRWISNNETVK
jgi:UDP-GlcNAc:undecaprenyl-phosphate/decaprenyl-phosphate GlcNAc-1-phosphate transferase